ncbi:hypothetical protein GOBAR_AA20006 [Gossypium barbadense]|uniref:Uncharacterized protein n=1 Tax=Gossypium barbadense TaxID=3634 RepID=A0A2P5XBD9_GOSBA|nr:hypothetical protein GOBAR_AA20006 [Gossypium barbadense]
MEQLNVITVQNKEGLVEPEPKPRQGIVVSKGKDEVDHSELKPISKEYKPRVPYPRVIRKVHTDEQFGELTLRVDDETIIFQARNLSNTLNIEGGINHATNTDHMMQPSLQETCSKSIHEPCSSNNKGPIYEKQRLQIEELDEWQIQVKEKLEIHDTPNQRHDEPKIKTNQFQIGDAVILDEVDPRFEAQKANANKVTPFTVLNIFSYGTVEVTHSKFETFKFLTSKSLTEPLNTGFPNPHGQAHGRALCSAHTTGGDTAVRYGHAWEKGTKQDTVVQHDRVHQHAQRTRAWAEF